MRRRDPESLTVPPDRRPMEDQPKWRRDFPIDWAEDEYTSRRDLVKFMGLTSLAFTTGQLWIVGQSVLQRPPKLPRLPIATVDELGVGESKVFGYPEATDQRVLIRLGETSWVAYDQKCTHLQCPVFPRFQDGQLHCPCHNGYFDLASGRPVAGPPRRPLPLVEIEVEDGAIFATDVVERTT